MRPPRWSRRSTTHRFCGHCYLATGCSASCQSDWSMWARQSSRLPGRSSSGAHDRLGSNVTAKQKTLGLECLEGDNRVRVLDAGDTLHLFVDEVADVGPG